MSDSKMTKLFELELFSIYVNLTFRKINNEGLNCLKLDDFLSRTRMKTIDYSIRVYDRLCRRTDSTGLGKKYPTEYYGTSRLKPRPRPPVNDN